jgi:hypothetical protein
MADIFSIHCPCIRHEHADKNKSGKTDDEIAGILQCSQTVFNIRRKFCENGLTVALDRKQRESPPIPRKPDGETALLYVFAGRKFIRKNTKNDDLS